LAFSFGGQKNPFSDLTTIGAGEKPMSKEKPNDDPREGTTGSRASKPKNLGRVPSKRIRTDKTRRCMSVVGQTEKYSV
jgi:hypothetical protein